MEKETIIKALNNIGYYVESIREIYNINRIYNTQHPIKNNGNSKRLFLPINLNIIISRTNISTETNNKSIVLAIYEAINDIFYYNLLNIKPYSTTFVSENIIRIPNILFTRINDILDYKTLTPISETIYLNGTYYDINIK